MDNSTGKVIAAFLAGAAVGATLGLLLAPDKGVNTRRQIRESLGDLGEKAKDTIDELTEKARESFDKYRKKSDEADDEQAFV